MNNQNKDRQDREHRSAFPQMNEGGQDRQRQENRSPELVGGRQEQAGQRQTTGQQSGQQQQDQSRQRQQQQDQGGQRQQQPQANAQRSSQDGRGDGSRQSRQHRDDVSR